MFRQDAGCSWTKLDASADLQRARVQCQLSRLAGTQLAHVVQTQKPRDSRQASNVPRGGVESAPQRKAPFMRGEGGGNAFGKELWSVQIKVAFVFCKGLKRSVRRLREAL